MAIIVVGGGGSGSGKTSVATGIVAALPEPRWTAFKISSHWHGEPGSAVIEACDANSETDTGRYLAAGAVRAFWVRGNLAEAMPQIQTLLAEAENVMIESNGILRFLQPDVYLSVLDPAADIKESATEFLERADAVLVPIGSEGLVQGKVVLPMRPPVYATAEVVWFVAERSGLLR
jgi:hypothetical protein